MAQSITDYTAFFSGAKQAVEELDQLTEKQDMLKNREKRLEAALKAKKKSLTDTIAETVKKRQAEVEKSYNEETAKAQDRLKKVKAKREKARNQGVKERIGEETEGLIREGADLRKRLKTLLRANHVPGFCGSPFYYALYFTRGFKEFLTLLVTVLFCFLAVPCGVYFLLPDRKTWYLFAIYVAAVFLFGGLYVVIGNLTKARHLDVLKEGRLLRNEMRANKKQIRAVSRAIRKDKDEAQYDLQKFDDEISQLDQELRQIERRKKEALTTFETVTKTIISDEITANFKADIDQTEFELANTLAELTAARNASKEKTLFVADNYSTYVGKEFMTIERLSALEEIIASGQAANITEALSVYRNGEHRK